MIATTKQLEQLFCVCCGNPVDNEPRSAWQKAPTSSLPSVTGGRICCECDSQIQRTPVSKYLGSAGQTAVERDYKAFLDGKRDYPILVQITCADGSEILSPVSDKAAKAFLVA